MMTMRIAIIFLLMFILPGFMHPAAADDAYQVISGRLILEVAKSYMLSHSPWDENNATIGFKREMADIPAYMQGKIDLEVEQTREGGLADVNVLKVRIDVNGEPYTRVDITPYISVSLPVVVATADIGRGSIIGDSDVTLDERDLTDGRLNDPLTDIDDVIGMAAQQSINKGDPVLLRQIDLPVLVYRGKDVTAVVNAAGMKISMTAQALDNGKMGEMVRIKNKASGAIITAVVIGQGMVEVKI